MITRFRRPLSNSLLVRLCLALPLVGLGGCLAMASPGQTLKPIPALVPHIMARAIAMDTLIAQLQKHLDITHPLEQEAMSIGGLGPIDLGMTIQEAANAAQVSFVVAPMTQSDVCKYYLPEVYDAQKAARTASIDGIGLMVVNDQVIRIDIWSGSPVKTISGLGIGSTLEEVRTTYDNQVEVTPQPLTQGNYLTLTSDASGSNLYSLVFETDEDGIVTQFRAGQLPAVTWTEGCS